ncbi:MAG TPA: hypothetical protein VKE41_22910 [Roseiflexaceae bacterium]|nr:hypothetical protein [Roseiflexaceae bacterium]
MRLIRAFGLRLAIGAVVLVIMAVGWAVTSVQRNAARGDAQQTVSWFYSDARFSSFSAFLDSNKDYLDTKERSTGQHLKYAFGTLDRKDFCNEFDGEGTLCPDELGFTADTITQQDNSGTIAHFLVSGKVRPEKMDRGRTTYSFSDDTYESFTHLVTLTKQGGSWYIAQVEPRN